MSESVEEFLARGGQVEEVKEAPRAEKCSLPFGGVLPVRNREFYSATDGTRWGGHRRMRDKGWKP